MELSIDDIVSRYNVKVGELTLQPVMRYQESRIRSLENIMELLMIEIKDPRLSMW